MTTNDGVWHLGVGDPTPVGWLTVIAYFLAAWGCSTVYVAAGSSTGTRSMARFWFVVAVALAALGINKQLDLQSALTEIGRILAHSGGWYERRHEVQILFIVAVGMSGALALASLSWLSWPLSAGRALALGGVIFLACFVLIQASSFHFVDIFLGQTALELRWNWILELSGIGLVGTGAIIERRTTRSRR